MMMNWSQENCLIDNHRKKRLLFLTPASDGDGDFTGVCYGEPVCIFMRTGFFYFFRNWQ